MPLSYVIPGSDTRLMQVLARTRVRSEAVRVAITAELTPLGLGRRPTVEWWADSISAAHVYRDPRFQTIVLGTLAALALGLTALGIFSVVAYLVAARTHQQQNNSSKNERRCIGRLHAKQHGSHQWRGEGERTQSDEDADCTGSKALPHHPRQQLARGSAQG